MCSCLQFCFPASFLSLYFTKNTCSKPCTCATQPIHVQFTHAWCSSWTYLLMHIDLKQGLNWEIRSNSIFHWLFLWAKLGYIKKLDKWPSLQEVYSCEFLKCVLGPACNSKYYNCSGRPIIVMYSALMTLHFNATLLHCYVRMCRVLGMYSTPVYCTSECWYCLEI